jgi:hypothetical protein
MIQLGGKYCKIFSPFGVHKKLVKLIKICSNETYCKICIDKHMSHKFPIQNGLKTRRCLSPMPFNCTLKYAIMTVQEDQVRLKLNGTHQVLVYADNGNLMGDNKDTYLRS